MKRKIFSLIFACLVFLGLGMNGFTQKQKETREVGSFTSLKLAIDGNVNLTQGPTSVVIEAEGDILKLIQTEVKDNALVIKFSEKKVPKHDAITLYISMPEIAGLAVAGSGDITAEQEIRTKDLSLAVSGSGDISLPKLTVTDLSAAIAGSGDITVAGKGTAGKLDVAISGSADFDSGELAFADGHISISGSGDCKVNVTGTLDVGISGSGEVSYLGNPRVNSRISGSGSVHGK